MLVTDATLADGRTRDVRITGERIAAVDEGLTATDDEQVIRADGRLLLPGMIDAHVHFRQPGFPHKETWTTGSRSAAAGGVTTVVDQPNTEPPTVSGAAFDRKAAFADRSLVDYGLNGGVTRDWDPATLFERPIFALGEVFLADSTGDMGVETGLYRRAIERATAAGVTVTVHAEDAARFDESVVSGARTAGNGSRDDADVWSAYRTAEAEIAAVEQACDVAEAAGARIHLAHVSTPEGATEAAGRGHTCESTPHHLLLARDDLPELGAFGRMNPPLRSESRRAALFDCLTDGTVDIVATDHAPHTRQEKDVNIWEAPSGVPGVETALPLLLAAAADDRLTFERVRDVTATNVAARFGLPRKGRVAEGLDADLVLVDPASSKEIRGADLHAKCGWTPFEGWDGVFPDLTIVRGAVVYDRTGTHADPTDDGKFGAPVGKNVRTR